MSRFYADIQGSKGEATRQGTEKSGIHGHIRGWGIGGYIEMRVNEKGEDVVSIYVTRGSNGSRFAISLGEFVVRDEKIVKVDE